MNLSSGNIFKAFAEQKFFSFDSSIQIENATGISSMGISGENGRFDLFNFRSGRIFDYSGRFVSNYSPLETFYISGNFNSGFLGYYINGSPISLSNSICSNTFSFDAFVFSTTGSPVDCSVNIFGENLPSYELVFGESAPITGSNVTGFLKNTSSQSFQSFKLFSGSAYFPNADYRLSSNLSGLKIKPNNSGQLVFGFSGGSVFELNSNKTVSPLSGSVSLSTNFGDIALPVNVPLKASEPYFLTIEQDSDILYGQTGRFWSFNLQRQSCSGTRFEFIFDDVRWLDPFYSFSNSFTIRTGFNNFGFVSSNVFYNSSTTRYIGTGFMSGAGCSGDDTLNTRFEIFHSHPSGVYLNKFRYSISGIEDKLLLLTGFLEEGI